MIECLNQKRPHETIKVYGRNDPALIDHSTMDDDQQRADCFNELPFLLLDVRDREQYNDEHLVTGMFHFVLYSSPF